MLHQYQTENKLYSMSFLTIIYATDQCLKPNMFNLKWYFVLNKLCFNIVRIKFNYNKIKY